MSLKSRGLTLPFGRNFAKKLIPVDGNGAAVNVAYHMSEASFLYPITPSTPMGEQYDTWASQGKKNVFGHVPVVRVLQSEAGAAGALHGAASVGTFCTTFTASQGLLLMIPNMFKTAGELWPTVFHVPSRAISTQALSIQGDHADIMCVKNTGFALLSSSTVQECQDMAAVAHMSTIHSQIPFIHFFEGFRLSHQIDSIEPLTPEEMKKLMPFERLEEIRKRSLNPAHPICLGHSQGPDAYFQTVELGNPYYNAIPEIVEANMDTFAKLTGRKYTLFDYYGAPDAEDVIVIMGAGAPTVKECIDLLPGQKLGVLVPRLFRPWSTKRFLETLPKTTKRVSVLDRSKDPAAPAEPLFMDVAFTLKTANHPAKVIGGRYGLASREFTPLHVKAVFDNMRSEKPKETFTVGINDDVTFLSLPAAKLEGFNTNTQMSQSMIWGLGGDGTVGANKAAIKAAIDEKGMYAQGFFSYSADKSNALTRSFLRFSSKPITSQYLIVEADVVGCTLPAYISQYPMIDKLKDNGIFFLNFPWTDFDGVEKHIPASLKISLAKKKAKFYVINATDIAKKCGLNNKISTIIQAVYYHLTGILGDDWLKSTEKWIEKEYGRLGEEVVKKNKNAARLAIPNLKKIDIPDSWLNAVDPPGTFLSKTKVSFIEEAQRKVPGYVNAILNPSFKMTGAQLPVSAFRDSLGGVSPLGSTRWAKKGLSLNAPRWIPETCVQCNACAAVCPHSVIRPFLLSTAEIENAPIEIRDKLITVKAKGKDIENFRFRIQSSPYDCVECELCVNICPTKSIKMASVNGSDEAMEYAKTENDLFVFLMDKIPNRGRIVNDKFTVRGSQFQMPQIEFPGSCQGCNQTMITKILTQLFGKRMIIANASGCSSVWGGSFSKVPFVTDMNGRGPAWARSLFEDNAEFGFGMTIGLQMRRQHLYEEVKKILDDSVFTMSLPKDFTNYLSKWYEHWQNGEMTLALEPLILKSLRKLRHVERLNKLQGVRDLWVKPSHWILGGDGWAYDIGYGGLDHIFSTGKDFNVLVFDNEIYANTGGQQSKATNFGAVAQFASLGKDTGKKDLGYMMMDYGNCYVASCALGSPKDIQYLIKCLKEAESYPGPSLVLCFCNCIMHHIKGAIGAGGAAGLKAHNLAVEGGYWPIYSFDPRRMEQGKNPFELKSKEPNMAKLDEFLNLEVRFNSLSRAKPDLANEMKQNLHNYVMRRYRKYQAFKQVYEPELKQKKQ
ncbi:pyruvate:ferredoxin oxidoreductase D [Tritrichomonas foetus]|uniref:Pyruvate:ferredoxin oxidoreductase D n=1 Tax=Tritrichomonas foetus TaxID=1144522 RepID=A0A1J4J4J0_9EUKA|nr:pyruvate:ferredoxin oxidoreductase D [Tritrichomonas foetus]|eukprot:OHS93633.1 pyruvate:ferredoxin oxidoreductase D [Tritrichomonas foetus]